ncbi:MAG: RimK family alpha-L-glutamate ligase [Synergistaceae bacterium]|nr:RimK family alpha-L-glutamate ligase [Synergistaceae bacterium]MBP9957456.1 RimK family alpha-L-glutamate ligase [Synergistaceae bacterium]
MSDTNRVIILGQAGGWHERSLRDGFLKYGVEVLCLPITRLISMVGGGGSSEFGVSVEKEFVSLRHTDSIVVRAIPGGSLEQVVYRMDALHALQEWGCKVINSAETIERSVDKFHASFLIQKTGIATPRTYIAERFDDAMGYFAALAGDIVLKPLFGSEGKGIVRISDPDIAYRTFRALEVTRSVYYLQEYLPSYGWDLRVFVLAGKALGCIKRLSSGWKTNISQGATPEIYPMAEEIEEAALRAAAVFKADYCGVDLYPSPEGFKVIEVNGIPGWRGFERATGIPVAEEIAKWMLREF